MLKKNRKSHIPKVALVTLLCVALTVYCCSCTASHQEFASFPSDFDFGVIETADTSEQSIITYYDEDLKAVHTERVKQGNLSSIYSPGLVKNRTLYLTPYGKSPRQSTHSLLCIDLETGKKKEHVFGKKESRLMGMTVNKSSAYVCSNLNGDSTGSCVDLHSHEIISQSFPNIILDGLYAHEDIIYASGLCIEEETYYLYELDAKTLKLLRKTDLKSPVGPFDFTIYKGKLYFTVAADKVNYPQSKNRLGCYDIKQKRITWSDFSEQDSMGDIALYKGLLLIAHTDRPLGTGQNITVFNPETESKTIITFNDLVTQMEIHGDYIYILSRYPGDGSAKVHKCTYSKGKLREIAAANVYTQIENENMYYYVGSFFVNDKEKSNEKE